VEGIENAADSGFKTTAIVMLLTPAEKKPASIEIATMIQP
jgi:hypothetical protein